MATPPMTEAEIIKTLEKTSLPTILVEGTDDAGVYRWLEKRIGIFTGNILPCSGRATLISIYEKRGTFTHGKLAWLADLDMWQFTAPPAHLAGIIFTTGYSIENDLYAGAEIESLLEADEQAGYIQLIRVISRWFWFEAKELLATRPPLTDVHIKRFVDFAAMDLRADWVVDRGFVEPPAAEVDAVIKDYKLKLRGKNLIQAIVNYLSAPTRAAKYSKAAIIEMCGKMYPDNPYIDRLVKDAKAQLV